MIRPSAAEIAPQGHFLALRAQGATAPLGPRNDKSGSIAPLNSCHQYCHPTWRPERRYRRNRCIPFYRQPLRIDSIAPGGACPSPTTHTWRLCKTFPFPFSIFHFPSSVSAALHYKKGRTAVRPFSILLFHFHSAEDIDGAHAHAEVPAFGIGVKIQVDLIALDAAADVLGHAVAIDILAVV